MDAYLVSVDSEVFAQGPVCPLLAPQLVSSPIVNIFLNNMFAIRYIFRFQICLGCIALLSEACIRHAIISKAPQCCLSIKEIGNSSYGVNMACGTFSLNGVIETES